MKPKNPQPLEKLKKFDALFLQKIIIIILPILLYVNTLNHDFALDDTMMITDNSFTKGGWQGLKKIFTTDSFAGYLGEGKTLLPGGRYRPLSQAFFNIYHSVFGLNPFGLHLLNILLFSLSAVLLFKVLRHLFHQNQIALISVSFLTTLLYIAHPLHTEVVANIKSLDLLLSIISSLGTLYFALKYFDSQKSVFLILIFLTFFIGSLSKETTLTFYGVIPLTLIFFKEKNYKRLAIVQATLTISLILYFLIRWQVLGDVLNVTVNELLNDPFLEATPGQKYATIFFTWFMYLKLLVLPHPLTHDYYPYTIEIQNWSNPLVIITLGLIIIMIIYSIKSLFLKDLKEKRNDLLSYGFLFFILVFSISSNLIMNIGTFMNERFLFVADIGIFIIISHLFVRISSKNNTTKGLIGFLTITVLVVFSILTIMRNPAWKDDYTLFTTDVKTSTKSAKCTVSAGGKSYEKALITKNSFKRSSLLHDAKSWVTDGLRVHPKYFQGWMLLGNINYELGNFAESLTAFDNCLRLSGTNNDVLNNIRNLTIKSAEANELDLSNKAVEVLLQHNYMLPNSYYLKAYNLEKSGQIDTAISLLQRVIMLDSTYSDAYNKLGQIFGQHKSNMALSEEYLLKALELKPDNSSALENLGTLYAYKNDLEKALIFFKRSHNLNPDNKQIYRNITLVYRSMNDSVQAAKWEAEAKKRFGN